MIKSYCMKINLNKEDLARVENLLQTNENNIQVSEIFNEYLKEYTKNITKKTLNKYKGSEEEKYNQSLLNDEFNMKGASEFEKDVINRHAINHIKKVSKEVYISNPYYKNIIVDNKNYKKWSLHTESYSPYELFPLDDLESDENDYFLEKLKFGFMDEEFPFLSVTEDSTIWMSVIPHEIETMKKGIKNAHGNVITFGLGLGYFAYMTSIKEEVKSVTIVEKDNNVISLFVKFILPLFSKKDKIKIIQEDAFTFLKNKSNFKDIDYAYVDIFHGAEDGVFSYIKFKQEEKNFPFIKFDYWLEESLIAYIRRTLITLIEESLQGYDSSCYLDNSSSYCELINNLYFKLKDYAINSYDDIKKLLSKENIIRIISQK